MKKIFIAMIAAVAVMATGCGTQGLLSGVGNTGTGTGAVGGAEAWARYWEAW